MTKRSLYARRLITLVGVVAALTIGFGSIQAAALWTAASAPLTVAPVSVATLQSQLADERNRSTAVVQQLAALESQSTDLAAALQAAHAQIDTETTHAANLAAQLKAGQARSDDQGSEQGRPSQGRGRGSDEGHDRQCSEARQRR
jgi:cytoskeletal protein RodZ